MQHLVDGNRVRAERALEVWRQFLMGEVDHPSSFEQHVLPFHGMEQFARMNVSPYLNRYALRSIDSDVVEIADEAMGSPCFTYVKLGRLIVVGAIQIPSIKKWVGTKVSVAHGRLGAERYEVAKWLLRYLNIRASKAAEALSGLSDRQRAQVKKAIEENREEYLDSEYLEAAAMDFLLSGDAAQIATVREGEED